MKKVLSASRRTDLVASHPQALIERLGDYPSERVHTIVLWTKNAANLTAGSPLRKVLEGYDQLFVHFSITGMGGSILEPGIPGTGQSLLMLPELIEFTGSPERISVRFDPVVNLKIEGRNYTNLQLFEPIASECSRLGIRRITTSWMTVYPKVLRRLARKGIEPAGFDWRSQADYLFDRCDHYGLDLHACCVEGLPMSRCIDGPLLQKLHPAGEKCSQARASGQRPGCGCTLSKDIGWYSQACHGGCLYCYARPAEKTSKAP